MRRIAVLAVCAGLLGGGAFDAACSSAKGGGGFASDAGGGDATTQRDAPGNPFGQPDASPPPDTAVVDSGAGGCVLPEAAPPANCSEVKGPCDIVSQDCPVQCDASFECDLAFTDGGFTTSCVTTRLSQHLPKGHTCCPSASENPCEPGLECIGALCDPDAAVPPTARCSPHCCLSPDGGDDRACSLSVPEGYPGHCDEQIVDNQNNPLYAICTYAQPCEPLHVEPCGPGFTCIVQDPAGTASCTQIFGSGLGAGQACTAANACSDGLMCLTSGGASTCYWLCYVQGQATPFDAGALDAAVGAVGYGGCPMGQSCGAATNLFPPWLGICL